MAVRLITLVLLVCLSLAAAANTLTGKVVKVADGDTITVFESTNTQHRIRLQGIDAPERKQAFGNASRKHLASLVAGKTVTVERNKRDRYARIVGLVFVDGHDVTPAQVKAGMAWFYRYYQRELSPEDRRLYADAENKTRNERVGLWRQNSPKPADVYEDRRNEILDQRAIIKSRSLMQRKVQYLQLAG